jgi:hypothetical protein
MMGAPVVEPLPKPKRKICVFIASGLEDQRPRFSAFLDDGQLVKTVRLDQAECVSSI